MPNAELRYFRLWLALGLAAALAVLVAALLPTEPSPPGVPQFDKFEHALTMAVLTVWFASLFPQRVLAVAAAVIAFGGLIELAQAATVYRDPSVFDWFADAAGTGLGVLLLRANPRAALARADALVFTLAARQR